MKTKEFLSKANVLVEGDRQKDYGDKLHNHSNISKLWSAYLESIYFSCSDFNYRNFSFA